MKHFINNSKHLKPCPNCQNDKWFYRAHILTRTLPWWWYIECPECHWCGPSRLFLIRAKHAWNKMEKTNE